MRADHVVDKVYAAYKNVAPAKVPSPSDNKYILCLSRIDDAVQAWADTPDIQWESLYKDFDVTTTNKVASLPRDFVQLMTTPLVDGRLMPVVKLSDKAYHSDGLYLYGDEPKRIALINKDGPEVRITGEYKSRPPRVTNERSIVQCENMRWLVLYVAAVMASGDPAKEEIAPDLFQQAEREWQLLTVRYTAPLNGSPRNTPRRNTGRISSVRNMGRTW